MRTAREFHHRTPASVAITAGARPTGTLSQTKYLLRNTPERVKIIRPHHPLLQQEFEVLRADQHRLVVQHVDGGSMQIPRGWTDADGEQDAGARSHSQVFTVEALRELMALIDALRHRD